MRKIKKMCWQDKLFVTIVYLILAIIIVAMIYPLIFVVSASISDPKMVSAGEVVLFPKGITFLGYEMALKNKSLLIGYANSIFYTFVGTFLNMLATIPCAYALSRREMKGRGIVLGILMFTMYFSGGTVPTFLNVFQLGLLDTRTILLIFNLINVSNLIIARTFFAAVPLELTEAAFIDGANDGHCFFMVVLPVSKAIMGVLSLYYAVNHWNTYFTAMLFLDDETKFPLQLVLRKILIQAQSAAEILDGASLEEITRAMKAADAASALKYSTIVLAAVPMLILYPFVQKYFEKGILIGSVKG